MKSKLLVQAARLVNKGHILYLRVTSQGTVRAAVRGDSGNIYIVELDPKTLQGRCTCPGYAFRGRCKHLAAVRSYVKALAASRAQPKPPSSGLSE